MSGWRTSNSRITFPAMRIDSAGHMAVAGEDQWNCHSPAIVEQSFLQRPAVAFLQEHSLPLDPAIPASASHMENDFGRKSAGGRDHSVADSASPNLPAGLFQLLRIRCGKDCAAYSGTGGEIGNGGIDDGVRVHFSNIPKYDTHMQTPPSKSYHISSQKKTANQVARRCNPGRTHSIGQLRERVIHIVHLTAAGGQDSCIGVEASMAAQCGAGDDGTHDHQRVDADGQSQRKDDGADQSRNAPGASSGKVQRCYQQEGDGREQYGADHGPHGVNDIAGDSDVGHALLHDKDKEDDGNGGDHVAESMHGKVAETGGGHFLPGDIKQEAHGYSGD